MISAVVGSPRHAAPSMTRMRLCGWRACRPRMRSIYAMIQHYGVRDSFSQMPSQRVNPVNRDAMMLTARGLQRGREPQRFQALNTFHLATFCVRL
eukprot:7070270-Prymnesium_polylepis.1